MFPSSLYKIVHSRDPYSCPSRFVQNKIETAKSLQQPLCPGLYLSILVSSPSGLLTGLQPHPLAIFLSPN